MTILYPEPAPYNSDTIQLDNGHTMAYYEYGNPEGIPVLYLHGGPGGGASAEHTRYFDPTAFRIITFDQRGCGNSKPIAKIDHNDPDILISDIETLRTCLNIDDWHVSGGSWGTTLSLLYAEEHPDRVNSLLLRGIFMMRPEELDSLYIKIKDYRPAAYKDFIRLVPEEERHNPLACYYKLLTDPDPAVYLPAAHAWCQFETRCSYLDPTKNYNYTYTDEEALACARIEASFFVNHLFTPHDRILLNINSIKDIPTVIVQGSYDLVCPPTSAYDLYSAHQRSQIFFTTAGHAGSEIETAAQMVNAADRIKNAGTPLDISCDRPAPNHLPGPNL